jgi:hypothetical protein
MAEFGAVLMATKAGTCAITSWPRLRAKAYPAPREPVFGRLFLRLR